MGSDGLIELDQDCWITLAKYNLLLATVFGAAAVVSRTMMADNVALLVENAVLAAFFGGIQTYAWISS